MKCSILGRFGAFIQWVFPHKSTDQLNHWVGVAWQTALQRKRIKLLHKLPTTEPISVTVHRTDSNYMIDMDFDCGYSLNLPRYYSFNELQLHQELEAKSFACFEYEIPANAMPLRWERHREKEANICARWPIWWHRVCYGNVTAKTKHNEFNLHWCACMCRKAIRITASSVHETTTSVIMEKPTTIQPNPRVHKILLKLRKKPLKQSYVPSFAQLVGGWTCSK